MSRTRMVIGVVVFALAFASFAGAEPLTLDEAVKTALDNNPSLSAASYQYDGAGWGQAKSVSGYLPKVYFESSVTRLDQDTFDKAKEGEERQIQLMEALGADTSEFESQVFEDTYSSSVRVQQPIFNGGKELVGIHSATMEKHRTRAALDDAKAGTVNAVKQGFFGVLKAAALVRTAEEALALSQETLKLTQARYEVGQLSRAEVLRWESQVAQAEGSLIQARNASRLARLNLNALMGVELDKAWDYPELPLDLDEGSVNKGEEIGTEAFPDVADVRAHPSMEEVDAQVGLSKSQNYLSITDVLPKANFIYSYNWEDNDTLELDGEDGWTATVALEIPLFQSLGGAFGIAQTHKNLLAAKRGKEDAQRGFLRRKHSAQLNMLAAVQRVKSAKKELAFADENYKITQSRQQVGAASNLDMLDAQFAYIQSKSRLVEAVADFRIAEAEWEYVTVQ